MGVNPVWKLGVSWVLVWKMGVSSVLVWKLGVSWVLRIQQTEAHSTRLRVWSSAFLLNYIQIFLFPESHHFGKCSYLIFLYIIEYGNISWRPHNLHDQPVPKSRGLTRDTATPGLTTSIVVFRAVMYAMLCHVTAYRFRFCRIVWPIAKTNSCSG